MTYMWVLYEKFQKHEGTTLIIPKIMPHVIVKEKIEYKKLLRFFRDN